MPKNPGEPPTANGFFDHDTVRAYFTDFMKNPDPVSLAKEITYRYNPGFDKLDQSVATVCDDRAARLSLADVGQCLYLDVGCWTGNGPKSAANHARHREFGVVCGNVAALCEYPGASREQRPDDGGAEGPLQRSDSFFRKRIYPLLEHLSSDPTLGDVRVISALDVHDGRGLRPDWDTLHVFLGDLHLPAITRESRTYIANPARPSPTEVLRCGRLDMSKEVKSLAASIGAVSGFSVAGGNAVAAGQSIASLAKELWARESLDLPGGITTDGVMTREEAKEWFETYHGRTGVKKGADIFQDAGRDLIAFIRLLGGWSPTRGKLKLIQLGDLSDFWIGMKCGFGKQLSPRPGTPFFVEFWRNQLSHDIDDVPQGRSVGEVVLGLEKLEAQGKSANPETKLLYGNHDNYLHTCRPASFSDDLDTLFAEHGHQSDSFNCDEDAVNGWALTQTAFLFPSIREVEDPASAAFAFVKRAAGDEHIPARLERIARGADVCLERRKLIYVMGHTHRPCLRRVSMVAECDLAASRQEWYSGALRTTRRLSDYGDDMQRLYDKVLEETVSSAAEAAAQRAREKLLDAARALAEAARKYEAAKATAETAVIAAARAAREAAEREVADLAVKAVKGLVAAEKVARAARQAAQEAVDAAAQQMVKGLVDEAVVAAKIVAAATRAAESMRDRFLALLRDEAQAAKRTATSAWGRLKKAGKWLADLPGDVASDLRGKAEAAYVDFMRWVQSGGY